MSRANIEKALRHLRAAPILLEQPKSKVRHRARFRVNGDLSDEESRISICCSRTGSRLMRRLRRWESPIARLPYAEDGLVGQCFREKFAISLFVPAAHCVAPGAPLFVAIFELTVSASHLKSCL